MKKADVILSVQALGFLWETADPFLFCVHHDDAYLAGKPVWTTSDADAGTVRAAKRKEFKAADPATTPVEIEPTKAGLLKFLNEHAVH